jgi:hypothetical protein
MFSNMSNILIESYELFSTSYDRSKLPRASYYYTRFTENDYCPAKFTT